MNIGAQSVNSPDAYAYSSPPSSATTVAVSRGRSRRGNASPTKPAQPSGERPPTSRVLYAKNPTQGDTLGSLSIPALGQTLPIIEGTGADDLKKGVGHFAQSVMPGQRDNCVLSGHRDTVFTELGKLKTGDEFIAQTAAGTFTYRIRRIRIVHKDDRTVIVPTDHAVLTVTTCYPFDFIGPAPDRYVLSADLVKRK
jgi:sortase A